MKTIGINENKTYDTVVVDERTLKKFTEIEGGELILSNGIVTGIVSETLKSKISIPFDIDKIKEAVIKLIRTKVDDKGCKIAIDGRHLVCARKGEDNEMIFELITMEFKF